MRENWNFIVLLLLLNLSFFGFFPPASLSAKNGTPPSFFIKTFNRLAQQTKEKVSLSRKSINAPPAQNKSTFTFTGNADTIIVKRPLPRPSDATTCASASGCLGGNVFEDFNGNGTDDTGDMGVAGIYVIVYDCDNMPIDTVYTDNNGDWQLCSLTDGTTYRVEFVLSESIAQWAIPSHVGTNNNSEVQFVQPGNCANFGVIDLRETCSLNRGTGQIGESGQFIRIGDTSNPADGASFSTTVNGNPIVHNAPDQIGRGAVNYEFWLMDSHVRVKDFLEFLNAVDSTNSSETWEGGLVGDNRIQYNAALPVGSRWETLAHSDCGQSISATEVEDMLVNFISFSIAARFANWWSTGDINQGAYTFDDPISATANITAIDSNWKGIRLPTEDEIYKALYWDQDNLTYNLYGTTTLDANGLPIPSDIDANGIFTVPNGNIYDLPSEGGCFNLIKTGQGGQTAYGLYFGLGDFHDMMIPHDATFPLTTNVIRPNNQFDSEIEMRSSFRFNTTLSFNGYYPSPGFRFASSSNPCLRDIEIGNYVWYDSLNNGIQDACERGIDSILVQLYNRNGVLVGQDTTSNTGQYYFNQNNIDTTGITVDGSGIAAPVTAWSGMSYSTQYFIVFGNSQFSMDEFTIGSDTYGITSMVNTGSNDNIDADVDGSSLTSGSLGARPDGLPFIDMTTSALGYGDHKYDLGLSYQQDYDYGDLPDLANGTTGINDYETYDSTGGPSHLIITGLFLGDTVDVDTDGFPDSLAMGDDTKDGYDDEDGITIIPSLNIIPGGSIRLPLSVTNTTGDTAYLEAWIDWNGDGDFSGTNEMISDLKDNRDGVFPSYLEIPIPNNALTESLLGFRIRISNSDNMTPYGRVNSGEIEDYLLEIACSQVICLPISTEINRKE